jgi:hypothetical protein
VTSLELGNGGGEWGKLTARFDGKKGIGRGPYIGQGVHGINSKDSRPLYLQLHYIPMILSRI